MGRTAARARPSWFGPVDAGHPPALIMKASSNELEQPAPISVASVRFVSLW
jgi:hypothetical protein